MRAIILSAGQGKRLLPLTESCPKCLIPVRGAEPALGMQLRALAACGVEKAYVMVGFGADQVDDYIARQPVPGIEVETVYNPFFETSDNLVTVWLARPLMTGDFVIMNGDTLFEPEVLRRLLAAPPAPLTLTINQKADYDDDDMKVSLGSDRRLRAVGKTLDSSMVDGESIGLMIFRGDGVEAFRRALDRAVRERAGMKAWYLSVVDSLTSKLKIETLSITGLWWGEVDSPEDLESVRAELAELKREPRVFARPSEG